MKRTDYLYQARYIPIIVGIIMIILLMCVTLCYGKDIKLSAHFTSSEFACRHCGECKVNFEMVLALEKLRKILGKPIIITSGYRCPEHNKEVVGVKQSQHLYGNAVDIKVKGYTPKQIAKIAEQCGFTWTKTYSNWTHIDIRK